MDESLNGELEEDTRQKIPFDLLEMELLVRKMSVGTRDNPNGKAVGGSME